ncbi:TPA: PapB/FocB family fimbrial expression transcriptional regulator, partial [Escherichia coli]
MRYSSYAKKTYNSGLQRASVNDEHFSLLIEISPIRSEKTIVALREYLVYGYSK